MTSSKFSATFSDTLSNGSRKLIQDFSRLSLQEKKVLYLFLGEIITDADQKLGSVQNEDQQMNVNDRNNTNDKDKDLNIREEQCADNLDLELYNCVESMIEQTFFNKLEVLDKILNAYEKRMDEMNKNVDLLDLNDIDDNFDSCNHGKNGHGHLQPGLEGNHTTTYKDAMATSTASNINNNMTCATKRNAPLDQSPSPSPNCPNPKSGHVDQQPPKNFKLSHPHELKRISLKPQPFPNPPSENEPRLACSQTNLCINSNSSNSSAPEPSQFTSNYNQNNSDDDDANFMEEFFDAAPKSNTTLNFITDFNPVPVENSNSSTFSLFSPGPNSALNSMHFKSRPNFGRASLGNPASYNNINTEFRPSSSILYGNASNTSATQCSEASKPNKPSASANSASSKSFTPYSLPNMDFHFDTFAKKQSKPAPKVRRTFKSTIGELATKQSARGRSAANREGSATRLPYKLPERFGGNSNSAPKDTDTGDLDATQDFNDMFMDINEKSNDGNEDKEDQD